MLTTGQVVSNSFSKDYRDYCFLIWWRNGRPDITNLILLVEKYQGRKLPGVVTLRSWKIEDNWVERADEYDKELLDQLKAAMISEKAQMLARHAEIGRKLQDYGMDYFETNPIDSQGAALRAIQLGVQTEGEAAQIEKIISSIAKMDDPQIEAGMRSLLDKAKLKKSEESDSTKSED